MKKGIENKLSLYDVEFSDLCKEKIYRSKPEDYANIMKTECMMSIDTFQAYILNKQKQEFDFIEKTVYDLSKFHLQNINKDIQNENITIEFWFKANKTYKREIHVDGDDNAIPYRGFSPSPLSIILYLDDNENPTMITNINKESYKYKKLDNKELCFIFPKKMKSIIFDGKYYHSEINIFDTDDNADRNILVIDIWEDYIPLRLNFYESKYSTDYMPNESLLQITENNIINEIPINNKIINDEFFLNLLYKKSLDSCKIFKDIIPKSSNLYDGFYYIRNPYNRINPNTKRLEDPDYITTRRWNEDIHITSDMIDEEIKTHIVKNFTKYEELNYNNILLDYILKTIAIKVCDKIKETYLLDDTCNIKIQKICLSQNITTNENHTIIASISLYDDYLYKNDTSDIIIKPHTLILQNGFNKSKNKSQIWIEFFIDIENKI